MDGGKSRFETNCLVLNSLLSCCTSACLIGVLASRSRLLRVDTLGCGRGGGWTRSCSVCEEVRPQAGSSRGERFERRWCLSRHLPSIPSRSRVFRMGGRPVVGGSIGESTTLI